MPHREPRAPRRATPRPAATTAEGEERYRVLFDGHPTPLLLYDTASLRFLAVNDAALRQYGYTREEFLAMTITELRPPEDVPALLAHLSTPTPDGVRHGTFRHRRRDGSLFHVAVTSHPMTVGGRAARLTIAEDITHRDALEQQLRQKQKMEAVGRLAGGIAHDFNNLLTTILTSYELMADALPADAAVWEDLEAIHGAALRGAALTAKLLAFSRRRPLAYGAIDVDSLLGDLGGQLRRMVPAGVRVQMRHAAAGASVRADPGAVEQIVVNLVTNACDAMPHGGVLGIASGRMSADAEYCRTRTGLAPGDYVVVTVSDSGVGMDEATCRRVFEPFFTTKPVGEGTGLGMAMVYGLVKQHGGYVELSSRPQEGTTVRVYLPATAAPAPAGPVVAPPRTPAAGRTILLVEDEASLRRAAGRVLTRSGYEVLPAADGREALELLDRGRDVDLIITDIVMPRLSGHELIRAIGERGRRVRVLLTSGYPGHGGEPPDELPAGAHFLAKPWTIAELLAAVRRALAAPPLFPAGGEATPATP